jgi:hypothetical protein
MSTEFSPQECQALLRAIGKLVEESAWKMIGLTYSPTLFAATEAEALAIRKLVEGAALVTHAPP